MNNNQAEFCTLNRFFSVRTDISPQEVLAQTAELLRCATSTAYEAADSLRGAQRDHVMSVMHLVGMAQAMVDGLLDRKQAEFVS